MTCSSIETVGLTVIALLSLGLLACSDGAQSSSADEVALIDVSPRGGSQDVDPNVRIQLEFDHRMADGMEQFCALHLGGFDGEQVPGAWEWSQDHHVLTFTPHEPLQLNSEHTLHIGGGITDIDDHPMDFDWHGFEMGGHWVDEDMLGGGMMGMHMHMDDQWQHHNGTYGMMFSFMTAP
jgi:hypothetical protein